MVITWLIQNDPAAKIWRQRGKEGEPWTLVFGVYMAGLLSLAFPPAWCIAYALWIFIGEKFGYGQILGQKKYSKLALRGFLIGGIGAIAFPASRWMQDKLFPTLSDYREAQEPLFGLLFHIIVLLIVIWDMIYGYMARLS